LLRADNAPAATATATPSGLSQAVSPEVTPTITHYEVSPTFAGYWSSRKDVFGEPISPAITETGGDGQSMTVQYFERARLELRSKASSTEFQVTLGRLGTEVKVLGTVANPLPEGLSGEQVTFKETNISTPRKFSAFWAAKGGAAIFGYPITPVLNVTTPDGSKMAVQYFERARFEYHPATSNEVRLTDLGTQVFRAKYGK
jgi:hypothetical protein